MHRRKFLPGRSQSGAPGVPVPSWDDYDPRAEAFFSEENRYSTGPGVFLPSEQQPYSTRSEGLPYKLCIKGIHHHTTAEGIQHILMNYGNPISIDRIRNKFHEVTAFVEFPTQREAENAIIALDGKPPLNWRISYAYSHRHDDRFVHELDDETIESEIQRQQPLFAVPGIPTRAILPATVETLPASTALLPTTALSQSVKLPQCIVCGISANAFCPFCKTRYCSEPCQSADWPSHQRVCRPPPPLEIANPLEGVRSKTTKTASRENGTNLPFIHKTAAVSAPAHPVQVKNVTTMVSTDSAHSFVIKGIQRLDQVQTRSNEASTAVAKVENKPPSLREGKVPITSPGRTGPRRSPKTSTNSLSSPKWASPTFNKLSPKPGVGTPPNIPPPIRQTAPQQPRMRFLGSQTITPPSHSSMSSANLSPQPDVKKYAKSYPKPNSPFPGNDNKPVVCVGYSKSPEEFFVQPVSHRNKLLLMNEDIQRSVLSCDGVMEPTLGTPCVAAFKADGNWYRAQILKIFPGNPVELGVRFVDYGNIAKMPNTAQYCRMLEVKFANYPGFAVKVKLADVLPPNGNTWESNVNDAFMHFVQDEEFMLEKIRMEEDQLVVRMKNRNGHDLGAELVRRGLAKTSAHEKISNDLDPKSTPPRTSSLVPPPPQVAQKPPLPTAGPVSGKATTSPRPAQKNAPASRPAPAPTTNFPRRESNDVQKPAMQAAKPVGPGEVVPTRSPYEVRTSPNKSELKVQNASPQRSQSASNLKASAAERSNSILSKVKERTSALFVVTERNDDHAVGALAVGDCDAVVNFHNLVDGLPSEENFRPPVNSIVSAFSEELDAWYRGCVLQTKESTYDIFYVDFGNSECGVQKLKPLPPDFDQPELAVKLVFPKNLEPETESFLNEKMLPDCSFNVKITLAREEECTCDLLDEDGQIKFSTRLEPWTAILPRKIPSPVWESGFSTDVMIISAEDVNQIFVSSLEVSDNFNQVEQELLKYAQIFDATPPFKSTPKPGTYVAAYFPEDQVLYRAKVISVEDSTLTVEYVDYGNSCSIPMNLARPLPDNLYTFPACGKFVSLSRVERPAGSLPEPVKVFLADCVNQLCLMFVVAVNGERTEVTITKDGHLINEKITNILESLEQPAPMPALLIAQPEESEEKPPVDNTLGDFKYDDCAFLNLPEEGSCQAIILSNDEPRSIMLCLADEEKLNKLTELQDEIQEYGNMFNRSHIPQVGEVCLARSDSDGLWYRAACIEIVEAANGSEHNKYLCLQVDYGEIIPVDFDGVRRIPKRFVNTLPCVAVQAVLKEFADYEKDIDDNLTQVLQELLPRRSTVQLSVIRRDGYPYVVDIPELGEKLAQGGFL